MFSVVLFVPLTTLSLPSTHFNRLMPSVHKSPLHAQATRLDYLKMHEILSLTVW